MTFQNRGKFTQAVVTQGREKHSHLNWVICHPKHQYRFDGVEGVNWGRMHKEYNVEIGGTIGYV